MPELSRPGVSHAVLVAVACVPALLLAGCGGDEKPRAVPTTVSSDAYSCTDAALTQLPALRRAVAAKVPDLPRRPRVRNYCAGGLDASVEFTLPGTVADAVPPISAALGCGAPRSRPGATGRTTVMRCHAMGMAIRTTIAPYLPADDPRGPTVLGEATLVKGS